MKNIIFISLFIVTNYVQAGDDSKVVKDVMSDMANVFLDALLPPVQVGFYAFPTFLRVSQFFFVVDWKHPSFQPTTQKPKTSGIRSSGRAAGFPNAPMFPESNVPMGILPGRTDLPGEYVYPFAPTGSIIKPDTGSDQLYFLANGVGF